MVSTRSVKSKFSEGEKVLCYEPDPAKTKVLYNSKVLDIKLKKDDTGRKVTQFLIHFQGWNSTWDRFVTEDFILKDTEENRKLQKELADKAQLTAGVGNLYKKERKKRGSYTIHVSRSSASSGSNSGKGNGISTGWPSSGKSPNNGSRKRAASLPLDERSDNERLVRYVNFSMTPLMKTLLEKDMTLVKQHNKIVRLPCKPCAADILQLWMKEYALNKIHLLCHRRGHLRPTAGKNASVTVDNIYTSINLCREVADGLRVYLDFKLRSMLYNEEEIQYRCFTISCDTIKTEPDKVKMEDKNAQTECKPNGNIKESTLAKEKPIQRETAGPSGTIPKEKPSSKEVSAKDKIARETPLREKKDSVPKDKLVKEKLFKDKHGKETPVKVVKDEIKKEPLGFDEAQEKIFLEQERRKSLRPRNAEGSIPPAIPSTSQNYQNQISGNKVTPTVSSHLQSPSPNFGKRAVLRAKTRSTMHCQNFNPDEASIDLKELLGPDAAKDGENLLLRPMSQRERELLKRLVGRKLLPDSFSEMSPSLIYGAVHLARSLVKMPELLATAKFSDSKLNLLTDYLKNFMHFLEEHPEWFSEDCYVTNEFNNNMKLQEEQFKKFCSPVPSCSTETHYQSTPSSV